MGIINRILRAIDSVTDRLNILVYFVFAMTAVIVYHVIVRYGIGWRTDWCNDVEYMLLAVLFSLPIAYTLLHQAHVSIDVVARRFPQAWQEWLLVVGSLFVITVAVILMIYGWAFAMKGFAYHEETISSARLPAWPVKFALPLAGLLLLIQALAELTRNIILVVKRVKA
ncbi:hypothetical protein ES703_121121 [subsurface metagenome]